MLYVDMPFLHVVLHDTNILHAGGMNIRTHDYLIDFKKKKLTCIPESQNNVDGLASM